MEPNILACFKPFLLVSLLYVCVQSVHVCERVCVLKCTALFLNKINFYVSRNSLLFSFCALYLKNKRYGLE